MTEPKAQTWYCYREFRLIDDEPRFLIPWSDPHTHEFPFNSIYESEAKAREGLVVMANLEDADDEEIDEFLDAEGWVLCKMTLEPILRRS